MPLLSNAVVSEAFTKECSPALVLYSICVAKFGTEIHDWEPETLWMEIQDEFKTDAHECCKDKLQAVITLVTTNNFWENFQAFEGVCKAFSCHSPDFENLTPLSVEECSWGVAEAHLLDETPEEFSEEVRGYVREILRLHGYLISPPHLQFCGIDKKYRLEDHVPPNLQEKVLASQKVKLKKIELHTKIQRDRIQKDLKKYFS